MHRRMNGKIGRGVAGSGSRQIVISSSASGKRRRSSSQEIAAPIIRMLK